jgi:hypothetical protein
VGQEARQFVDWFPFRKIHVASLVLCIVFLPWSTAFLSIAQMLMVANWLAAGIVRGGVAQRARQAFRTGPSLVFLSLLGIHVLGLLWTSAEGMQWGLDLIRILLPILTFGVVLSSTPRLEAHELRSILLWGAWSALASAAFCWLQPGDGTLDYRARSIFTSHIRLALMLCFAIAVFLYHMPRPWWGKLAYIAAIIWTLYFLNALGSIQSVGILGALVGLALWLRAEQLAPTWRIVTRTALLLAPLLASGLLLQFLLRPQVLPVPESSGFGAYTPSGEPYTFDATNPQQENGHLVWTWIAWNEVERTWPTRSALPLDSTDVQGRSVRGTLVRYMTSLQLRKDSAGIMALSDADIAAIEQGRHNAFASQRPTLHRRVDEVLYELGQYRAYARAGGHSVTMRWEFWRTGWAIAKANWIVGVGTGDTQLAFNAAYDSMGSSLDQRWRLRAHQQWLTLFISFGVIGLSWCLFAFWWPAWRLGAWQRPLFFAWAIVFGISCLTEDTLETQVGATFFALYYALFVFAAPKEEQLSKALPTS